MPHITAHDLSTAAALLLKVQEIAYRISDDPGAAEELRRLSFQCGEVARTLKYPLHQINLPIAA
ncbi:hypothetical protein [Gluconobacter albidus]|uniref:Histidine kinase n=1 Tax=Gluconobacter albidus TaxID=318683 RepID=A0AAW3R165_9PROT|nr:hypothetical protein [Gluconobacter albidus]KXV41815.1 hypothetical protein AD941_02595 [Gluconobacter albidus]GBQ90017.1 hypothetical protein AA3250_1950 [Gluconobacter albidus NBRC 3250]GLQ69182.1 hypothetical protein GCM10007866_16330 [Gluconobacter albidus]